MEFIYVCLRGQCFKLYHEVCCIPFALLEGLDLPLGVCCFGLIAEYCLEFFYKFIPILGVVVFVKLVEFLLCVYSRYTSSEAS